MTKREEAIAVLECFAQAIENGTFALRPEMKQLLGDQYAEDIVISAPFAIRKAIETLKDPDETSQTAETTDQR